MEFRTLKKVFILTILNLMVFSLSFAQIGLANEIIREKIDELWTTGKLNIGYSSIASKHWLPDLYERNDFELLWQNPQNIEDLLNEVKIIEEDGLNISGIKTVLSIIPCWKLKPCSDVDRKKCDAYYKMGEPCWIVRTRGDICSDVDCRDCNVYLNAASYTNIKELIKQVYE